MKSHSILCWKVESAQKAESAQESRICKKWNLHKKVESAQKAEFAQESRIYMNDEMVQCRRKTLSNQTFLYLNTTRHSSIQHMMTCDSVWKTQI